jgi:CRP/FNR family cyclic AMP-dependent transcriptional regulator
MNLKDIADFLGDCDLFNELDRSELEKIAGLSRIESHEVGDCIFSQGERGKNLWIIAEGSIFLERAIDLGGPKGKATVCLLGRGRALGCWATLLDQKHNLMSTAICNKPSQLVVFNGYELRKMMIENRELGFKVLQNLCLLLQDRIQCAYGAMENI